MEKVCIPFRNAETLTVNLLVSGPVISFSSICLTFYLLKEKQATVLLPLMLVYTANVLIILLWLLWPELFPPIATKWVHPLHISLSFWVLTAQWLCSVIVELWSLIPRLLLLVTGVRNQNQFQPSARNLELSLPPCSTIRLTIMLPHACCISGFISLCTWPTASISALGKWRQQCAHPALKANSQGAFLRKRFGFRLWRKLNIGFVLSGWVLWLVGCTANDQHA